MNLKTYPVIYFGYEIDETNNIINFDEGSGELVATISTGSYSFDSLSDAIKLAMNAASTLPQVYFVTPLRSSRKFQIQSTANFDLLVTSGTQSGLGPWNLIGFTNGDRTGANTYTSESASGSQYKPQFLLQDFLHPDQDVRFIDSSINESASGDIQTVSFGTRRFMSFSLKFITNSETDGFVIRQNPSGYEDAISLLKSLIRKGPIEIMLDEDNRNDYLTLILENTDSDSSGTGYILRPMTSNNLPDFYESGVLKFRVVE